LEDLASVPADPSSGIVTSLPTAVSSTSLVSASTIQALVVPAREPLPPSVEEFDELIAKEVANYVEKSIALGGLVAEQVLLIAMPHRKRLQVLILSLV
jgi:adenylyl cyclase-associated protein